MEESVKKSMEQMVGSNAAASNESCGLLTQIKQEFHCKEQDIRAYSPLTLAYMGDAVYELVIRTVIVERANRSANDLHKKATRYVKAETQAKIITALAGDGGEEGSGGELTEDEKAVYKRGRNAKSYTTAKNATMSDYRKATGFEALVGFLYLTGQMDRVLHLVKRGIELAGLEI